MSQFSNKGVVFSTHIIYINIYQSVFNDILYNQFVLPRVFILHPFCFHVSPGLAPGYQSWRPWPTEAAIGHPFGKRLGQQKRCFFFLCVCVRVCVSKNFATYIGTYPKPPTNSLRRNSFHLRGWGCLGYAVGVCWGSLRVLFFFCVWGGGYGTLKILKGHLVAEFWMGAGH